MMAWAAEVAALATKDISIPVLYKPQATTDKTTVLAWIGGETSHKEDREEGYFLVRQTTFDIDSTTIGAANLMDILIDNNGTEWTITGMDKTDYNGRIVFHAEHIDRITRFTRNE
ncbi:MAG: hypothetical protein WCL60_01330 [Methylococcales bacterium]